MSGFESHAVNAFIDGLVRGGLSHVSSAVASLRGEAKARDLFGTYASRYQNSLVKRFGSVKIFGMSHPVHLRNIYTRVNVLKHVSANRYARLESLDSILRASWLDEIEGLGQRQFGPAEETKSGLEVVNTLERIIVLGKPGSGKTTFLRHLIFEAFDGNFATRRVPIYISLHRVSTFKVPLMRAIFEEFEVCGPGFTEIFVNRLLAHGNCVLLLDGLDEVSSEEHNRIVDDINSLSERFPENKVLVSCRIAAFNSSFPNFSEIEVADFTDAEIKIFVDNWFGSQTTKQLFCIQAINTRPALRDLSRTPLLLAIICIALEENLELSNVRSELYEEAIGALLKKWDSSRSIKRDEVYERLTSERKQDLLSYIAATSFVNEVFFFRITDLSSVVETYLRSFPVESRTGDTAVGSIVIRSIEAQHGLLVERARGIHSFSHMTFQEYFTARHLKNGNLDLIKNILQQQIANPRWREVFVMLSSMLSDADDFLIAFLEQMTVHGFKVRTLVDLKLLRDRLGNLSALPRIRREQVGDAPEPINSYPFRPERVEKSNARLNALEAALQARRERQSAALKLAVTRQTLQFLESRVPDIKDTNTISKRKFAYSARLDALPTIARDISERIETYEFYRSNFASMSELPFDHPARMMEEEVEEERAQLVRLQAETLERRAELSRIEDELEMSTAFSSYLRHVEKEIKGLRAQDSTKFVTMCIQSAYEILKEELFSKIVGDPKIFAEELEIELTSRLRGYREYEFNYIFVAETLIDILKQPIRVDRRVREASLETLSLRFLHNNDESP